MEERNMRRDKGEIDSWIYNGITTSIQEQIMEHMNAIRSLEEELERLKTDDICQDFDMDNAIRGESLWRNLELIEKKPSSYTRNDVRFDEDPCYATLDLVVEKTSAYTQIASPAEGVFHPVIGYVREVLHLRRN